MSIFRPRTRAEWALALVVAMLVGAVATFFGAGVIGASIAQWEIWLGL